MRWFTQLTWLSTCATIVCSSALAAHDNIVNVYAWAEEIPDPLIRQFEKETGIKVNYATYDSNEIMYAKLRTNQNVGYDIVEPSSYYVVRLQHQDMLEPLDKTKLPNYKNLDPFFTNLPYDPNSTYSVPFYWGTTGIYYNQDYFKQTDALTWSDLLKHRFINQLMILDDAREVFAAGLLMLGYSVNDRDPEHIKAAYLKLKSLLPNVRVFNMDAVTSILIDEDATVGMTMNGDVYNAMLENPKLQYVYPTDGFLIWVDNFAILKNAPHRENAYRFLNYLMRADVAREATMTVNYATANRAAWESMPPDIKNNPILYPSHEILKHGEFQMDIGEKAFALTEKYWEQLKMQA